jgi:hypothetical protein
MRIPPAALCAVIALSLFAQPQATKSPAAKPQLDTSISFAFDIPDLVTNHQSPGQINNFHIRYVYARILKNPGYDKVGHVVSAAEYPFFQTIREDIVKFVQAYRPRDDFYEVFAEKIGEHVMDNYPQLSRLDLTIDVPGSPELKIPRSVSVTMSRR